jgi:hypothetical protein
MNANIIKNELRSVWQRGDTICYATKPVNRPWDNWGPQFGDDGLQSAHPFVETYGDSALVGHMGTYGVRPGN